MSNKTGKKLFDFVIINGIIIVLIVVVAVMSFSGQSVSVFLNGDRAIYKGNTDSNYVSLMFNVYWGTEYITNILSVLERYGVKATFFIGGSWAEKNIDLLRTIADKGHEIANHGYFHSDCKTLGRQSIYDEIYVTHKLVQNTLGQTMTLFAPPSGSYNSLTLQVAQQLGYNTIMWSKDTIDWRDKDSALVYTRATKNVKGGDLILMHPTAHTLKALPDILSYYGQHNLQAVTVSQNINGTNG
ncbi:MAG: polysaccharide deacetylase family protein [Clostridia bacterium]|nr:polysaccharide deacetylase family protein [Clostridia bacterium]